MHVPKHPATVAKPEYLSRNSFNTSLHPRIDATLKDLKLSSRKFSAAHSAHANEFRVLERLYYKSKNQHRLALFWRNVSEMRRYCKHLYGMSLPVYIDLFRSYFWGENAIGNIRMMKGAWSYIPDSQTVETMSRRLQDCVHLLEKSESVFQKSYQSFTSALQSCAFAQLLLTLLAVASRLNFLTIELLELCRHLHGNTIPTINRILQGTHSTLDDIQKTTLTISGKPNRMPEMVAVTVEQGNGLLEPEPPSTKGLKRVSTLPIGKRRKVSKMDDIDVIFES